MAQTNGGGDDDKLTLVIGNKNYSSWSLRAWLPLAMTGASFEEIVIPLDREDTPAALREHSPTRRVPVLRHGNLVIWDSLAIAEYLAERFPEACLWPEDVAPRANARSAAAEMHSGFADLRKLMPMDVRGRHPCPAMTSALEDDIARICALWQDCRDARTGEGDFLFGAPSIADAFFAPVASRFVTYRPALPKPAEDYIEAVWSWQPMRRWAEAAEAEPWHIENP